LTSIFIRAIISIVDITIIDIANLATPKHDITERGMAQRKEIDKYLPLSESTCYVMLALVEPAHGYAIMQKVEAISEGAVKLGPGTLYGVLATLEKEGLILKVKEEDRRKVYALTPAGRQVLAAQIERLEIMARCGLNVLKRL
jgi:hypothetical protein